MENSQMIMKKPQIIAIDFDGTMVEHDFPRIGKPVSFAINVCKRLMRAGHKIMLWTMRSDNSSSWSTEKKQSFDNVLTEAVQYMVSNGIELWGINKNPDQNWSSSNKQYANLYIDDMALGCPLITEEEVWNENTGDTTIITLKRPYVNWKEVDSLLQIQGYYKKTTYEVFSPSPIKKEPNIGTKGWIYRKDAINNLLFYLKTYFEDVFLAQAHTAEISTSLWYQGAGLYVDFELIVPQHLLDDEDTDINFSIGEKEFSITCHN